MHALHDSVRHGKLTLALLVLAAGISLLVILGPVSGISAKSASWTTQCLDAADVLAALDRSRNGVSLTCNQEVLSQAASR